MKTVTTPKNSILSNNIVKDRCPYSVNHCKLNFVINRKLRALVRCGYSIQEIGLKSCVGWVKADPNPTDKFLKTRNPTHFKPKQNPLNPNQK